MHAQSTRKKKTERAIELSERKGKLDKSKLERKELRKEKALNEHEDQRTVTMTKEPTSLYV